jgi:hypothetical protein
MIKIRQEKYKANKVDMNNKRRAKYHDIDMEVDVNKKIQINNTKILICKK